MRFFNLCALLLLFTAVIALGQTSRGTVTGIVTDPQAGVVPGATVEITNLESGVKRSTTTNEAGLYRFDAVDPGEYTISVAAAGFKTTVVKSVVQAGQVLSKDARLEVGEPKVVIEVQAGAQPLQYEAPVRGGNLEAAQITQLPFSSRDATALALTLPGVSTDRSGFSNATFIVNGSRGRSNNFMVDGTDNNDVSVAGQAYTINMTDAVAEVSVQTANFDAEYGRAGGAVVNTITKQGTNQFHGSLFSLLDATIDDAITNTQALSTDVVNRGHPLPGTDLWYGVTVGGPIKKNKTFFLGSFQDERQNSQNQNNLKAPTAAGWTTFNSLFPNGANARADIYRKVAGAVVANSQPFTQVMGDSRPGIEFGTAIVPFANKYTDRQLLVRVDHQISEKEQISGRYFRDKNIVPTYKYTDFFPGYATSYEGETQSAVLSETHIFSPSTTNEFRLPYSRVFSGWPPLDPPDSSAATLPLYTIGGGVTALGVPSIFPQVRLTNTYSIQDTVSHVRSTHSFRFGLTLNQQRARQDAPARQRGEIAYGSTTGYSNFANFIDDFGGGGGTVYRDFGSPTFYPNFTRQAYFAQDRWRATQNVTVTLGVRYEYFGQPMNVLKKVAFSGLFNTDVVTATGPYLTPNRVPPDKNNWAPTVGLAYSPSERGGLLGRLLGDRKTVIRTGYQIGYDSFFNNITSNAMAATPNLLSKTTSSAATGPLPRGAVNWSQQMPLVARTPLPTDSQTLMSANLVNPYYQHWSLGFQRELPANLLLDVSYVGTKGTKLFVNEDNNPVVPSSMRFIPSATPSYALSTRWDAAQGPRLTRTNGGDSNYHALQIGVDRRLLAGLLFKASYTWSKTIDNASEILGVANSNSPQNTVIPAMFGGLTIDRGLSMTDRPHRAVFSCVYQLPFMKKGKGVLGQALGGWQLSGVTTFESGRPLNISNGLDADGIGGNYDRPNFNPNGTPGVRAQCATAACTSYINPDAANVAIDPATAMYIGLPTNAGTAAKPTGNLGRNTARMPGLNNFNANIQKTFKVRERFSAEFRTEFYNIWNHPQFGTPSVSPFSPGTMSMSASVAASPAGYFMNKYYLDAGGRVIRYQLRLLF
jgi:hypothetical protein